MLRVFWLALVSSVFAQTLNSTQLVHLSAPDGSIQAQFLAFGATLQSLWVKDKHGVFRDIVLGYDNITNYLTDGPTGQSHPYLGPVVGRYANRIKNGTFSIPISQNPKPGPNTFHIVENENGGIDTLHGGAIGYDRREWTIAKQTGSSVTFKLIDPAGFQGFPGQVTTLVTYSLANHGTWNTVMHATAKQKTPIMLSSHVYWNFEAYKESQNLNDHMVQFEGSRLIATDGILIPNGKIDNVKGGLADFSKAKSLGKALSATKPGQFCGTNCTGFDNCWIYDKPQDQKPIFSIWSTNSGIKLDVTTDQIALQIYTCNGIDSPVPIARKASQGGPLANYIQHSCLVIEQESVIDAINQPGFGINQIFGPSRPYEWSASYKFSTVQ